MFDSQADVAAVVYGADDDPDGLLRAFADDVQRSGFRVVGLVQAGHVSDPAQERLPAVALPTRAPVSLRHIRERAPGGCHLDEAQLAETRRTIAVAMSDGADLVIINRFGKLEAAGAGLVEEIKRAVVADIPVLIAVPHWHFRTWTRFCAGMTVKLACSREAIDAWWGTVTRPNGDPLRTGTTFCALAK
ncbi:MAG TPA: DUF2478 domain-containing protein [Xanthobacteraceae bacterium]|nr:DUF2478 domain-containing protein [Xanthobacteraceae bacterium]